MRELEANSSTNRGFQSFGLSGKKPKCDLNFAHGGGENGTVSRARKRPRNFGADHNIEKNTYVL